MTPFLEIQPEVISALKNNQPVVALESTIISHGMPYPQNIETARKVEEAVRNEGAIPATIAIKDGKCLVGLSSAQMEFFGKAKEVWKVSLRDMPFVISKNLPGATTVASTMRIASIAGIKVFATGGIGGVHRGATNSMDISADLTEMSQTNVAVVSAGIKSILDIGLTLEYLETQGVPVVTFGQSEFPGFYSNKTNWLSPLRLDSPKEIAQLLKIKWQMGLNGSVLIANPIPAEKEILQDEIETHIRHALSVAEEKRIRGKEITPFLLKYIADHTRGESLEANIALVINNAKLAAKIAMELVARL
ncbi:MAG TPA: pseudouridine-5'-phosphate glycosidase [Chitinophagaceae bacterium]|nr:pseudouridine-5'-phosphate glycosidase [Chitinophagaceae bacterium]